MACSSCGKKRLGLSAAKPFVLGSDNDIAPQWVKILDPHLLSGVRKGEYRFVRGSGVGKAFGEGKIAVAGATKSSSQPPAEFCVEIRTGKRCFRTLESAERYSRSTGSKLVGAGV